MVERCRDCCPALFPYFVRQISYFHPFPLSLSIFIPSHFHIIMLFTSFCLINLTIAKIQLFIVLRQPVNISVIVFSNPIKLTNYLLSLLSKYKQMMRLEPKFLKVLLVTFNKTLLTLYKNLLHKKLSPIYCP